MCTMYRVPLLGGYIWEDSRNEDSKHVSVVKIDG